MGVDVYAVHDLQQDSIAVAEKTGHSTWTWLRERRARRCEDLPRDWTCAPHATLEWALAFPTVKSLSKIGGDGKSSTSEGAWHLKSKHRAGPAAAEGESKGR